MKLTPKQRLKICIVGQFLLLISVIIPTILLANKDSTYYRFGPNEDLIIISIKIQKKIEGFTRKELQVLANIMFMLNAIRYALTLQLAIVQMDIAVLSGVFDELAAIPTIYILLKDKEFVDELKPLVRKEDDFAYQIV